MAVLLGLLAALCYGSSDFAAGAGGRRSDPVAMTLIAQPLSVLAAIVALAAWPGARSPGTAVFLWGAIAGLGSGLGTVALYRGLAVARMSVVAPTSAVLSAALPALTGLLLGERLHSLAWAGIVVAMPAVALISAHPASEGGSRRAGVTAGLAAGVGFGVQFIGIDRAGTSAGAWPLLPCQAVALLLVLAWAAPARNRPPREAWPAAWRIGTLAGVLAGAANLLYLAATGYGQLAVVAVLTALYPAATVLLARLVLHERWSGLQMAGLVVAAAAITAISIG